MILNEVYLSFYYEISRGDEVVAFAGEINWFYFNKFMIIIKNKKCMSRDLFLYNFVLLFTMTKENKCNN